MWKNVFLRLVLKDKGGNQFIQKLTPGFKNHTRDLDNFIQVVESPKS